MTTVPGIFAGGDCVFGPRLIIDSIAADGEDRRQAGIDRVPSRSEARRSDARGGSARPQRSSQLYGDWRGNLSPCCRWNGVPE